MATTERSPRRFPVNAQIVQSPATNGSANAPDHFVATAHPRKIPAQSRKRRAEDAFDPAPSTRRSERSHPLAIEHQEEHRRGDERREEDVEHGHAALDDVQAVERQQERREAGPPDRAPEVEREEIEQGHTRDPEYRRGRRHPIERCPIGPIPSNAMIHLPSGGCTQVASSAIRTAGGSAPIGSTDRASQIRGRVEDVVALVPIELAGRSQVPTSRSPAASSSTRAGTAKRLGSATRCTKR